MIYSYRPSPALRELVRGYTVAVGLAGEFAQRTFRFAPQAGANLLLQLAGTGTYPDGTRSTSVYLGCCRSSAATFAPGSEVYSIHIAFTVLGMGRLLPELAREDEDCRADLSATVGQRRTQALLGALGPELTVGRVIARVDAWLLRQLATTPLADYYQRFQAAYQSLQHHGKVSVAAHALGVSERQFNKWFKVSVGLSPKRVVSLERLRLSLNALRSGKGDPTAGFYDQAHQIRCFRAVLGVTPGQYLKQVADGHLPEFAYEVAGERPEWATHAVWAG